MECLFLLYYFGDFLKIIEKPVYVQQKDWCKPRDGCHRRSRFNRRRHHFRFSYYAHPLQNHEKASFQKVQQQRAQITRFVVCIRETSRG